MSKNCENGFYEWRELLGSEWVVELDETTTTISIGRIAPANQEDVLAALSIARKYSIPLYPISTGKNWGFGGLAPTKKGSVILDLSRLDKILSFDKDLGLVRVEPGVTINKLRNFLVENAAEFISPSTGAELSVSLIGNALERGRSGVPYVDRFSSLVSLKAILADGSSYESPSTFFKWGVGPYIDGLFGQSNLGIVVEATFALSPKSNTTHGFYIAIKKEVPLSKIVDVTRECQYALGSTLSSSIIQNAERVVERSLFAREKNILFADWQLCGMLSGERAIVEAAQRIIKSKTYGIAENTFFFSKQKLDSIKIINSYLPFLKNLHPFQYMEPLFRSMITAYEGKGFGGMWFLKNDNVSLGGLLFVPAVLPIVGEKVSRFVFDAKETCDRFSIPFPVALLNFTPTSLLFGFLITFNPENLDEKERAFACYRELTLLVKQNGGIIYRGASSAMDVVIDLEKDFWKLAKRLKLALDPQDIISPGRYMSPLN